MALTACLWAYPASGAGIGRAPSGAHLSQPRTRGRTRGIGRTCRVNARSSGLATHDARARRAGHSWPQRQARLAAALRSNLQKRKQQARERVTAEEQIRRAGRRSARKGRPPIRASLRCECASAHTIDRGPSMDRISIVGGKPLNGTIPISGRQERRPAADDREPAHRRPAHPQERAEPRRRQHAGAHPAQPRRRPRPSTASAPIPRRTWARPSISPRATSSTPPRPTRW